MIDFLSSWVKNLSLALIIVSILEMILPNSKTKKYIKMVMGIYILFTIVSPVIESNSNFDLENINWDFYEKSLEEVSTTEVDQTSMDIRLNQLYKEQLEEDITNKLNEKGYKIESCKVTVKISQGSYNNNTIEKIVVKIKEKTVEQNISDIQENNSIENKIVTEIEKIKKVEVRVSEESEKDKETNNDEEKQKTITRADIELIKDFLIEEYGVNEKCLKIS